VNAGHGGAGGIPGHDIVITRDPAHAGAHIRFTSGHRLNPLTRGLVTDLIVAIKQVSAAAPPVITLQGGDNFSCGAHKDELATLTEAELDHFIEDELELCDLVAHLPMVTIAAVQGACIGNAADLALSCDLRVACDDAVFAWPEVRIGYPAPVHRLAHYVGRGLATQLAVLGEQVTARRAHELGLVSEVVTPAALPGHLKDLAERAASLPRSAVAATKQRLDAVFP
jgi:enoyl-CoA hydratase/carnithine racemase